MNFGLQKSKMGFNSQCGHCSQNELAPAAAAEILVTKLTLVLLIYDFEENSNPSCRNMRSKLSILYGKFEKKSIKNGSCWGKKPISEDLPN
jgi:hypothetical protein